MTSTDSNRSPVQQQGGPLAGLTVLDVSIMAAGPWTGALLGMLGADVIKVEPPAGDGTRWVLPTQNGMGTNYMAMNVNKKDVTLDLKTEEGRNHALALARGAHILVQNFRVGVMDRLGLGYEQLREVNPRLIYCSISGFGETGPLREAGCSDPIMQAYSGFARLNGAHGESLDAFRFTGFIDLSTAAVAVEAVLAALIDRERDGQGQEVRVSMLEAALEMQCTRVAEWLGGGELAIPRGSESAAFAPDRAYQSADHEIFVSVCRASEWTGFCQALEMPDLAADARFATNQLRVRNRAGLDRAVEPVIAKRPAIWWLRAFGRHGVASGLAHHFESFRYHQQIVENEMIAPIATPWGEVVVAGPPWHFTQTPCVVTSASMPDEHNAALVGGTKTVVDERRKGSRERAPMLEGLKIVEIAEGVAGPLAALRLSELGTEVVKVEPSSGDYMRGAFPIPEGDEDAAAFVELNRGKRSFALGSAVQAAGGVLKRLVEQADVLITDHSDEQLSSLGLQDLIAASERGESRLIVISISPWGRRGPISSRKGSELTAQAMAGYTRYLGIHGQPARRLGADVASVGTATFAVQAALAALYWRAMSGRGQRVDLSLCNSLLAMKSIHLAAQSNPDEYKGPRVGGANHPPELGWGARDGRVFMAFGGSVGPTGRAGWSDFVKEVGLEKLINDPRCDKTGRSTTGHGAHVHELRATYEEAFARFPAAELVALIRKHRGNAAVYYRLDQTLTHPQTQALEVVQEVTSEGKARKVRRFPARFSKLRPKVHARAPRLGEHSGQIARELGMCADELSATCEAGGSCA